MPSRTHTLPAAPVPWAKSKLVAPAILLALLVGLIVVWPRHPGGEDRATSGAGPRDRARPGSALVPPRGEPPTPQVGDTRPDRARISLAEQVSRPARPADPGLERLEDNGPEVIQSEVHTLVPPGYSVVTGGYLAADGSRDFAVLTPTWIAGSSGGAKAVQLAVSMLHIDPAGQQQAGLGSLATDQAKTRQNAEIWTPQEVRRTLEKMGAQDLMSSPTVVTMPGRPAAISIGTHDGTMMSLKIDVAAGADGGIDLHCDMRRVE